MCVCVCIYVLCFPREEVFSFWQFSFAKLLKIGGFVDCSFLDVFTEGNPILYVLPLDFYFGNYFPFFFTGPREGIFITNNQTVRKNVILFFGCGHFLKCHLLRSMVTYM